MTTVGDVLLAIEAWAPHATAQSYDNVGLLVGSKSKSVSNVLTALDLVPEVIREAVDRSCDLIITHHPTIFAPIRNVRSDSFNGALLSELIKNDISLIAAHTNLDATRGGVSFALAEKIGLKNVTFLDPLADKTLKLVTFVPPSHLDAVRTAVADSGAGIIGDYDTCGFGVRGTGNFRALPGATPFTGKVSDEIHEEEEVRYEVELSEWDLASVLSALRAAHPYEELAYDIYPVRQPSTRFGMGAIGDLEKPLQLSGLLQLVSTALGCDALKYVGSPESDISRVAVCGGSGSSLTSIAMRSGAQAFVTGDITYHKFFDVLDANGDPSMALVDAGHFESESMTADLIARHLQKHFDNVVFHATKVRTSPIRTYLNESPNE